MRTDYQARLCTYNTLGLYLRVNCLEFRSVCRKCWHRLQSIFTACRDDYRRPRLQEDDRLIQIPNLRYHRPISFMSSCNAMLNIIIICIDHIQKSTFRS